MWELLRRLLLEHHHEADDTEAQVAFAQRPGRSSLASSCVEPRETEAAESLA
jgi:hypothetical protein